MKIINEEEPKKIFDATRVYIPLENFIKMEMEYYEGNHFGIEVLNSIKSNRMLMLSAHDDDEIKRKYFDVFDNIKS